MIYAVDRYIDVIRQRRARHPKYQQAGYDYFDTEEAARDHIINRAEIQYVNAKRRLRKVIAKYGKTDAASQTAQEKK